MTPSLPPETSVVVDDWSAVEATGRDACKFLNNFCTNDVAALAEGESCEAMFTDVKAHVIAYAWVARIADQGYVALLSSPRAESLHEHLDKYLIREQVELAVVPPGPWTLSHGHGEPIGGAVALSAFGDRVVATRGRLAEEQQLLSGEQFERLRITLGVPLDGIDVDSRNLPQEVDRNDRAISFTKGCYLGQEPVARIDALGRVNWLLRGLAVDGPAPDRGAEVTVGGKPGGRVTSAVGTDSGSIALAYVRREHASGETAAKVGSCDAAIRVLPLGA
ncbi:hypothetical protein [Botrimarina sp.]|uniref:CAF17-like 4Fe-4S cluster assembly/insertion protein YgfZ n=1 Tax=Botrimarina sp. TaxID=2795802 RepID=UPI0032EEDC42